MFRHGLRRLFFGLQAPQQLRVAEFAQRWGQRGGGNLAQAALVVAGGKRHQLAPRRGQGGQGIEHLGQRAQHHPRRQVGVGGRHRLPHHPQQLALPQGHAHQGAGGQRVPMGVAEQTAHIAVQRGLHRNVDNKGVARYRHGWKALFCG